MISTFEIHVGELRATFLRNHNTRRHKDPSRRQLKPGRQPTQTTQAQKTPTFPATTTTATSVGALHLIRGTTPDMGRCTRYVALHPLRGGAPDMGHCTRTEEVHCLRIGCSAPTNKNKRGTDTPNHSPPHPSMRSWALLVAGWARRPRRPHHHLHSGPLQHLPHPYMRRAGFRPQLHPNYEEPLFGKAVGHSRQRRWRRPTRMMETSSCWDRIPILLRSGGVFGPAKARSWIG